MAELTLHIVQQFRSQQCITCGVTFALTSEFDNELRKSHQQFFCPNGHRQFYGGKSEAEIEREKANRLRQQLDQAEAHKRDLEKQISAAKGQATKLRKRIGAGVCPCCHRTVKQLAAHMANKHPDFAAAEPAGKAG